MTSQIKSIDKKTGFFIPILRSTLILFATIFSASAQILDQSFGDRGWITENIDHIDQGRYVLIQPDNKILIGGNKSEHPTYGTYHITLFRYNADGTRDSSFGNNGLIQINVEGKSVYISSLDLQSDGKIIFTGIYGNKTYLFRYLANGMPDPSFGTSGYKVLHEQLHTVQSVFGKILPNNDLLVAHRYYNAPDNYYNTELWKYDQDGVVDTTFGINGKVDLNFGFLAHSFPNIELTSNNSIILSGFIRTSNQLDEEVNRASVVKLNADGTLDTAFGNGNGYIADTQLPNGLPAVQDSGQIILASAVGVNHSQFTGEIRLVRYNTDGTLDTAFGLNGYTTYDPGSFADFPKSFLLQPDGKILLAGQRYYSGIKQGFLTRFDTDGSLDTSFSPTGTVGLKSTFSPYHGSDTIFDMAYHGASNLIVIGEREFNIMVGRLGISDLNPTLSIPDTNFEQALIDLGIDSDGLLNGQMPSIDAKSVISLDISNKNISDLTGIEGFAKLENLNCKGNQLTSLDLSLNTRLLTLDCTNNSISELRVGQNTKITSIIATDNLIDELFLVDLKSLETLLLTNNRLTILNIRNGANHLLSTLDTTSNPNLICIEVDPDILTDVPMSWQKDATSVYGSDCQPDTTPPTVLTNDVRLNVNAPYGSKVWVNQADNGSYDDTTFPENLQLSLDRDLFYCSDVGVHTIILTVTDEAGNSATGQVTVTVVDNKAPSVTAKNIYRTLDVNGQLQLEGMDFLSYSSDNCREDLVYSLDKSVFTCADIGRQNIVLTATDKSGNSDSDTAWVQISGSDACNNPLNHLAQEISGISCHGANDAVIQVEASGGAPPYLYELSDDNSIVLITAQVNNTFVDLDPGDYVTKVIDNNGQETFFDIVIQEPLPLDITGVVTQIKCNGGNDGQIEVIVTGGSMPYNFRIIGGTYQTSNLFDKLAPGQYTIETIDTNGCSLVSPPFVISEPVEMTMAATKTDVLCNGALAGQIEITANGGTAPYQYRLNGGAYQNNSVFENLSAGRYTPEVMDANGCAVSTIIAIVQPEPLTSNATVSEISCKGSNDGSIEMAASGGTSPYEYSLDGISFSTDPKFTGLSATTYVVWVRDVHGCTIPYQTIISEPNSPDFDNDGLGDTCDNDIDGDGILNVSDQCAQTPIGSPVDSEGCPKFSLPSNNFTIQATNETCASSNNGSILLTANEDLDYMATLNGSGNAEKTFTNLTSFEDLEAGAYEVCITVSAHPEYEKCFSVQIGEPEELNVDAIVDSPAKLVTLKMNGGNRYNITLNNTEYSTTENEITLPLSASQNSISVKTDINCQGVYEETILTAPDRLSIFPNPVEEGEINIVLHDLEQKTVLLTLFSDNGVRIREKTQETEKGGVQLNMDGIPAGVYTLIITTEDQNHIRKIIRK